MEVKQDEITQEKWDEMKKIAQENVCAICASCRSTPTLSKAPLRSAASTENIMALLREKLTRKPSGVALRFTPQFATISSAG